MKKKKILIILLIIIIILLAIVLILKKNSKISTAKEEISIINNLEQDYSDYILPFNRDELMSKYEGELSHETIYVFLYRFATDILPQLKNEHITDAKKYFNNNKEYIHIVLGIDKVEDFEALIEKINTIDTDELEFTKYQIEEKSARRYGTYTDANLIITYNEDITITVKIRVSKVQKDDITSVSFK